MKMLAQLLIQSLDPNVLDALTQRINRESANGELSQNHYYVEGSFQERVDAVGTAFRKWCDARDYSGNSERYYWWGTSILAIYDDYLVFYYFTKDGEYLYRKVMYSVDPASGDVTIGNDLSEVDVKLVIDEIVADEGDDDDDDLDVPGQAAAPGHKSAPKGYPKSKKSYAMPSEYKYPLDTAKHVRAAWSYIHMPKNRDGYSDSELSAAEARIKRAAKKFGIELNDKSQSEEIEVSTGTNKQVKQDAVGDEKIVATSAPVSHSDGNPKVNTTTTTDADESGASMPSPNADAASDRGVQHSDDDGAGKGPQNPTDDDGDQDNNLINGELDKAAAGYKGEDPAHPGKNVSVKQSKVGNDEFLLQDIAVDKAKFSYCTILEQSVKEESGKKLLHIQGIATRADIVSAAGFVYPLEVWEQNLDSMNEQAEAGKFIGKLEHPDQEQGLKDTAIRFKKFWIQGADVYFDAVVLDTDNGKELQALIAGGVQIDMSSRGYGTAKKQSWRGQTVNLIQDDFVCTGFDAVHYGASTGSGITDAKYQSKKEGDNTMAENATAKTPQEQARDRVASIRAQAEFKQSKADLIATCGLSDLGLTAYKQALDSVENNDLVALVQTSDAILPPLQKAFPAAESDNGASKQAQSWSPTYIVKQSQEDLAPKTAGELIDRLVADLPDTYGFAQSKGVCPNHFSSPREACRRLMQQMARERTSQWDGNAAILGLLALEQGKTEKAQDILEQSLATGATTAAGNADGGGAPLSAPLIFPLVRRVFPRYIMNEIAAIQPMDRPEGKIFYLDQYRTEDPAGFEKRIDLNTSSNPFNSSYADNGTEGAATEIIRLRLTSLTVDAHTKKLGAQWSIEDMQDLRAYHGLDAAQELMGGVAREMALEWNLEVLNDMLNNATAAALTFGKTAPASGFPNQVDWDAYIWRYIEKLDNAIFSKRQGEMTHIVCGVDAAVALSGAARATFDIGGENGGDMRDMYPGATYFGVEAPGGGRYKILKTNFWGAGTSAGSKILGLRRGQEWSDTPYIWAPYTDYVTPVLTDPADFSQKQGIVSRAAKQVVVGDAMGTITVDSSTGELV
jgi:hypothetical protein